MQLRKFNVNNMNKLDRLMEYLFEHDIQYCVSYSVDDNSPIKSEKCYKAFVTWHDGMEYKD